jgi:hypothetical protein
MNLWVWLWTGRVPTEMRGEQAPLLTSPPTTALFWTGFGAR